MCQDLDKQPVESSAGSFTRQARTTVLDRAKTAVKRLLYSSGTLSIYHRLRNRSVLTVAMFHRVLAPHDPRWNDAGAEWTLSDDLFEDCLRFFKRHYTIVSLRDVISSLQVGRPLPPRSLLLTFDDGYADNEEYALPALRRHGLPAVVFITTDFIGEKRRPWTEDFLQAYLRGSLTSDDVRSVHAQLGADKGRAPSDTLTQVWEIVRRGPQLRGSEVRVALSKLSKPLVRSSAPAQMLQVAQIRNLIRNGVAVGAHGKTHSAFPTATDVAAELRVPRCALQELLADESQDAIDALSFPHGAHTREIVDQAFQDGYRLLFTVREELTPVVRGQLTSAVVGRINVSGPSFAPHGRLRPELLAFHFFRRPHAK